MRKYIFILFALLLGSNLKSIAKQYNYGYVSGPENVTVGNSYTYYTPEAVGEESEQYLWTLSSPYGWLFTDSATVSNHIDLIFDRPGVYYLLSNHGYDLQIFVTDNGYAVVTPRFAASILNSDFIKRYLEQKLCVEFFNNQLMPSSNLSSNKPFDGLEDVFSHSIILRDVELNSI